MASKLPNGDRWVLIDNDNNSQNYSKKFKFDFSYIESENIKNVVKAYTWRNYREGNLTLSYLRMYTNSYFKVCNKFLFSNKIESLKTLKNKDVDLFMSYLKTYISNTSNKVLSYESQKKRLDILKNIVRWGQLYMPNEVPKTEIFTGNEYIGVNRKLKIDFIPDDVLEKINNALKYEDNPYIKYGIIILQSTGMRLGDMFKLTTDCIKPHLISGYTITWYDHKNRKQRQPMPVTNECAIAVQKLMECTKDLRENANDDIKNYLFIYTLNSGRVLNFYVQQAKRMLDSFIENNDIRDTNGELYSLTAHQFRRTLATDMLSKGTDINIIRDVLGHSSSKTTKNSYADIKDKERGEIFKNIGIIGNINKVNEVTITDKQELKWFNENKDNKAKMEDGYCTKPCTDGKICDRLLKRQKCYTCSRYITTPEYLQVHKNHLVELERQLEGNIYGEHYAEHFIPTIEILKEIVKRLEEIQDGNKEVATTSNK